MELTINISEYITKEEMKSVAMEAVRDSIMMMYSKNESEISRLISNLSYEFIFNAVSEAIGEDAKEKISTKVKELLEDDGSIRFELWRKKDVWEKTESPAIPILYKAIKDNEGLIREKVVQSIDGYHFDDVQDAIYYALDKIIREKVFGSAEKGGAE